MELETFKNYIQQTVVLSDEVKAHFLSQAESYAPEKREEIIQKLKEHEDKFLKDGKARLGELQEKKSELSHQKIQEGEEHHKKEIVLAEAQLAATLADM